MAAILPLAAAVSAEPAVPPPVPVAISHPLTAIIPFTSGKRLLPEAGLLLIVGSGLLGLAAVMRKTTRA